MTVPTPGSCRYCTIPIDSGDTCAFCVSYSPPDPEPPAVQQLDDCVNRIDDVRYQLNALVRELPETTGMRVLADVATALFHLQHAAVLLDGATDQLETAAAEVTR